MPKRDYSQWDKPGQIAGFRYIVSAFGLHHLLFVITGWRPAINCINHKVVV
jgi:hypothetical protein